MSEGERVWRVSLLGRVGGALMGGGIAAIPVLLAIVPGEWQEHASVLGKVVVSVALFLCAGLTLRATFHPRISMDESGVRVVNFGRPMPIPWAEIRDIEPGYLGITFYREPGPPVTAWAVSKSNMATWSNWSTRADDVVHEATRRWKAHMLQLQATAGPLPPGYAVPPDHEMPAGPRSGRQVRKMMAFIVIGTIVGTIVGALVLLAIAEWAI